MPLESREERFQLLRRNSSDSFNDFDPLEEENARKYAPRSSLRRLLSPRARLKAYRRCLLPRRRLPLLVKAVLGFLLALLSITGIFFPSYTRLPPHYQALRDRSLQSSEPGRANPNNEKIFISISLYDKGGKLAGGEWGEQILEIVDLIGPNNTFLSIYENANGPEGEQALMDFKDRVPCPYDIVYEDVDKNAYPKVKMIDGRERVKRIEYIADIRNRALRHLDTVPDVEYDKILFMNDIFVKPIDVMQLLFSTNQGPDGKTDYLAACSMDFQEAPLKFYDNFAARDFEGYSMGVPFYPFFSNAGRGVSRRDIIAQRDAVRVKACWGGMAATVAKPFMATQKDKPLGWDDIGAHNIDPAHPVPVKAPVRFRAEPETYFDSCECCLIMADLLQVATGTTQFEEDNHIYMNPYVRVSYSPSMLAWIPFLTRFERLYPLIHWIVNKIAHMPTWNAHREVKEGDKFTEEIWIPTNGTGTEGGHWELRERHARNGMYCGVREMQILKSDEDRTLDRNWLQVKIPTGRDLF